MELDKISLSQVHVLMQQLAVLLAEQLNYQLWLRTNFIFFYEENLAIDQSNVFRNRWKHFNDCDL